MGCWPKSGRSCVTVLTSKRSTWSVISGAVTQQDVGAKGNGSGEIGTEIREIDRMVHALRDRLLGEAAQRRSV